MGSAVGDFTVTVTGKEVVAAALPLQEHWLPLSNLDLLLPPLDVSVFFCYADNPTTSFREKASALKEALAEALVSFYAFAGEVVGNPAGEPEILCNNRGVEFLQMATDVELRELRLYDPDSCVEGKLVPSKKNADAYSANMFLVAWAHIATGTTTITPSFRRSLLNPRRPLSFDPALDDIYVPYSSLPAPPSTATGSAMISRIYHLTCSQLSSLQAKTTANHKTPSKLQTLSAYLWKLIAQQAFQRHNDAVSADDTCKMGIVVDGRQRLGPTMDSYFGNVLSVPFARLEVKELTKMPLADVAEEVGRFLANAVSKEHFLGLVDWVEDHRSEPAVARVYTEATKTGPGFVMSSGQRFPVTEVDFGWGRPVFGSYHFPWGGSTGYVMPMPSPNGNGDWVVYMHLFEDQLDFIEDKASHVFRPFTLELVK
ncbi:hypothetical protein V2J09_003363 [Rumex salicifolius]